MVREERTRREDNFEPGGMKSELSRIGTHEIQRAVPKLKLARDTGTRQVTVNREAVRKCAEIVAHLLRIYDLRDEAVIGELRLRAEAPWAAAVAR